MAEGETGGAGTEGNGPVRRGDGAQGRDGGAPRRRSSRGRTDRRTGSSRQSSRPDQRRTRSRSTAEPAAPTPAPDAGRDPAGGATPSHVGARRRRPSDRPRGNASGDLPASPSRLSLFAQRRGLSVTTIGIAVGMAIFLMLTLAVPVRTYIAQRNEFNQLQESNAQLRRETQEYKNKLAQQSDPAYIEVQARQRLQYVPKGEKPVVIINPTRKQQEAEQAAERQRAATPWYENLMDAVSTPPDTRG
ncbi:FtsB family cell division protein [Gordonia neofelifaecis]|uniref:Septum formation initiator n=1 Tax=Gordonia neofelifaecis NRRL B-59395 TaxID=644548 RepID=F1YF18_9ACTN|nr:septum formation initiator family protein [Gordonia neofelifaecis]EGD56358.1 hypothetical protein SCNU_02357 [Gordonia neofelifaecis NRRL B-59395]